MNHANAEKIFGENRTTPDSRPVGKPLVYCAAELNTSHTLLQALIYTAIHDLGRFRVTWDDLRPDIEARAMKLWYEPTSQDVGRICEQFSPNSSYRDFLIWNGRKLTDLAKDMLKPEKFTESVQTQNTDDLLLEAILHVACENLNATCSNAPDAGMSYAPVAGMEFEAARIHSDPSGADLDKIYTYFEYNYEGFDDLRWNGESLGEVYEQVRNREWRLEKGEILSIGIDQLELRARTRKVLETHGLVKIGDLVRKSTNEMLAIPNFSRKSYFEVRDILESMDLSFGMNTENQQETNAVDVKEMKSVGLLMTGIRDLGLSAQATNRIESTGEHDFTCLGDVLRLTENEFIGLPYISRRTLNEIRTSVLAGTDLHFGMEFNENLSFGPDRDISESNPGPDL